tara:strand:- start:10 stop:387 length:378 start_codon:yes stop_codon:yes gene_type:complete
MNIPNNLLYTKEHEWCLIENDYAVIGITDFAQSELGDIVFIEFPTIDQNINKDESVGTIEAVKTVADLFSPLSGTVVDINDSLENEPNLLNDDPYDKGWIFKLKLSNKDEVDSLLNDNNYKNIIA